MLFLARLEIEESQKEKTAAELSGILAFVEKISELDLSSVEPTNHILNLQNVTRPDETVPSMPQEEILFNAPHKKNGFMVVPRVI